MNLSHGGHLTHGHPLNFSGRMYKFVAYGVRQDNEQIDYGEIEKLAAEHKPKMIVAGASAYSRVIDFPRIAAAAKSVGALFLWIWRISRGWWRRECILARYHMRIW